MSKLSLKMKLGVGFGVLLALMAALGFVGYTSVGKLAEEAARVDASEAKKEFSLQVDTAIEQQSAGLSGFLIRANQESLKRYEDGKSDFNQKMDELEKLLATEQDKKMFAHIQQTEKELGAVMEHSIQLCRAGKTKEATNLAFSAHAGELRAEVEKTIDEFEALEDKLKGETAKEQDATEAATRTLVLSLLFAGLLIGVVVAILIARSITGAISAMVGLIQEIAANNLAIADMKITSQDEIGKAGAALNGMKNNLREMIQSIAGTAEHVASASEEISSSATQQAQGAETQKDQTTQVATAMQEMPRSCAEAGVLQRVVPLAQIPEQILQATRYRKRA